MPSRPPPLLQARIPEQIFHRPVDLAPQLIGQDVLLVGEVHRLKILEETIEERAEPDLLNRIEVFKRLQAAEKNRAEFGTVVERFSEIAPLHGERIYGRLPSFLGLFADLGGEVNQRWNTDKHGRQLADR